MFEPKLQGYYGFIRYAASHCKFEPEPLTTLSILWGNHCWLAFTVRSYALTKLIPRCLFLY